jgi:hypothetical protein
MRETQQMGVFQQPVMSVQAFSSYGCPCAFMVEMNVDGFVKSPDAALRFIPRHCGVRHSTPHSSEFARLACGLFTKPSHFFDF